METKDKFIAFIDILGFSSLVERAEASGDLSRPMELVQILGDNQGASQMAVTGPLTCPQSNYVVRGLDFQITQVSDCVVISVEVSPAGAINLMNHCFGLALKLLDRHAQCRGSITRGNIHHDNGKIFGTGYQAVYKAERSVAFLRADDTEKGTPFVQIDPSFVSYVSEYSDNCVREMFARLTLSDGEFTALYPFKALAKIPSTIIHPNFDPSAMKLSLQRSLGSRLENLQELREEERKAPDDRAKRKVQHYIRGLDDVIAYLRNKELELDRMIATGIRPPMGSIWGA